jgi:pimeloyl-ACP methyl ester carboxylesterase
VPASARNLALVSLAYSTSQGRQTAFYLPPRNLPLRRLWVLFPGNGSLALDWLNFLDPPPDPRDGFLLIDYPGYGDCQGFASPDHIQESAEAAFGSLAQSLHTEPGVLEAKLNLLCLSIGCATGLNFAVRHPVDRIILVAPFTTLRQMARRVVGWPLCYLLMHNFDNGDRLTELAARANPPRVTIFHGDADQTIPMAMGRQLAGLHPGMITFHAVPGAGHNTVLFNARSQISAIMRE